MKDRITIIGSGNVAYHLCRVFSLQGSDTSIYGRNQSETKAIAHEFSIRHHREISEIDSTNLILLCVKDDQITAVSKQFPDQYRLAYTSGTVKLNELEKRSNLGVFYPLQSFTKGKVLDFEETPILIEANNSAFSNELFDLAGKISKSVQHANSEQRNHIHLGAVLVNNFSNHLFHLAKTHLDEQQLDWKILLPLIQETVNKIKTTTPFEAQTGPARRNDLKTIQNHLDLLQENPNRIYRILSDSIREMYQNSQTDDHKL